jgi:FtsH-binding integral membrane protein
MTKERFAYIWTCVVLIIFVSVLVIGIINVFWTHPMQSILGTVCCVLIMTTIWAFDTTIRSK